MKKHNGISIKALLLLLVLILLVGGAIGGTFAWLVSKTDPVVNTFVAGDIQIELKEHVLDLTTGKKASPEAFTSTLSSTSAGNQGIMVVPGRVLEKDPTLTVLAGSEPCYVRVLVKIHWTEAADAEFSQFTYDGWFQFNSTNWESPKLIFNGTKNYNGKYVGYDIYELAYRSNGGKIDASTADVSVPIMYSMTIPENLDNDAIAALQDCGVDLIAQAVQTDGLTAAQAFEKAGYPDGWESNLSNDS